MRGFSCVLLMLIVVAASAVEATRSRQRNLRFGNFDDYLLSVVVKVPRSHNQVLKPRRNSTTPAPDAPSQSTPTDEAEEEEADAEEDDGAPQGVQDRDVLGYFRDVPRRHWSCCMLGILAGTKGFHCHVQFYAAEIARKNRNRAHSRKMMFHGRDSIQNWGRDLMTTFGRCVTREVGEFHRCCRTATDEVRERQIWQRYRQVDQQ